ncbi:MAG: hypothetical protein JNL90_20295 [Planctomycetes bacterium]|nr:hypothetical protein [Planctomycetota bacterium]
MNARALLLLLSLLAAAGCHGYYPRWHYAPSHSVHAVHVNGSEEPRAVVGARIVGVLRPEELDGQELPRRLHARLEVENRTAAPLSLDPRAATLRPSGGRTLAPSEQEALSVPPNESRRLDLHFPLPDAATLADSAYDEVELAWPLQFGEPTGADARAAGEGALTSRALFRRVSVWAYDEPWYGGYGPYGGWYGRGYYDPFWPRFDPWCDGPGSYGFWWHVTGSVAPAASR